MPFIDRLRRLDHLLDRLLQGLCALLVLALLLVQLAEILLRNLGVGAAASLFALSPALVLWLSLGGAAMAQTRGRHVTLALLPRLLPGACRRLSRLAGALCGTLASATLLLAALHFVGSETTLFGWQRWPVLVYPLFFALLLLRFLLQLAADAPSGEPPPIGGAAAGGPR
jgi:TRAP-type C4-dicarboxylate transport system permease small subunit